DSSLVAILESLDQFKLASGLGINVAKSCLFLDGNNLNLISQIASAHNLSHGALPVRYLGVPLLPHKLNASDYQPLLDKMIGHFRATGGWVWRRLTKLRSLARPFIFCDVVSGRVALFWHDNWTGVGPLISIIGAAGPRVTGINLQSFVCQASSDGNWSIPRGRHPLIQLLRACLQSHYPPTLDIGDDIYLWKTSHAQTQGSFSSAKTWRHLHPTGPSVPWLSQVWFKEKIPKHAFLAWLTVKDRLTTRDRLRSWNLHVPSSCLLCLNGDESRDHLFFSCNYSKVLWLDFFASMSPPAFTDFTTMLAWIKRPTTNRKLNVVCKLVFHALLYNIWIERNNRIHSASFRFVVQLRKHIQVLLRSKLAALDRAVTRSNTIPTHETFLSLWFDRFQ
ncbi:unnamed protein product, partial [Arabidopsis halleri]